jgi:DNA primase
MDYEHIDFPSAVRKLAARVGIPVIEERGPSDAEDRQHEARRILLQLHGETAEWFHENLIKKQFAEAARKYLKERGITAEIAKRWRLGYAPDEWDAFGSWARERGYETQTLIASGLVKTKEDAAGTPGQRSYDRFRDRIMFPICNDVGEVIAFSGRLLKDEEGAAKYLNSPETAIFRKGSVLFGLDKSKRSLIDANSAVVCEGQIDLIRLFEAGITNVVAPQGTAFTENQARVLKRYVREIVLCYDSDRAGQKAAEKSLSPLLRLVAHTAWYNALSNHFYLRIAEMPPGKDPDTLVQEEGADAFRERITSAPDFFDYWIDRASRETDFSSLTARMDLAASLASTVSEIHDPMFRGQVEHKVASRLSIPVTEFKVLVKKPSLARAPTASEQVDVVRGHDIAVISMLVLRDQPSRNFLFEQNWREVLEQTPGADLLIRLLESELRPNDAASLNAFMSKLSAEDESLVSAWLMLKMPGNAVEVTESWWSGLRRAALRRQLAVAEGRIKIPGLSTGDIINLQKQILDLQEQLRELPKLSSAARIDS